MEDYKKKYEEAMLRMNKWVEGSEITDPKKVAEFVFPELRESEDERIRKEILSFLKEFERDHYRNLDFSSWIAWLEKQRKVVEEYEDKLDRMSCESFDKGYKAALEKQHEKIDAIENFDTEFEKQVSHLIASTINKEHEYNEGFIKWTANALLNYAKKELEKQGEQKPAWSEEDEDILGDAITAVDLMLTSEFQESNPNLYKSFIIAKNWLKSLKERMKGE